MYGMYAQKVKRGLEYMDIVDIYLECGDFYEAVARSGLPTLVAHVKLLKSGVLKIHDKIKYGSINQKRGAEAEELFQKLVPNAIDANKFWKINNPIYDFMYKELTIDVKYASLYKKRQWSVRISSKADFTVVFLERAVGAGLNKAYILLIPYAFVEERRTKGRDVSRTLSKKSYLFEQTMVLPESLVDLLDAYAETYKKE